MISSFSAVSITVLVNCFSSPSGPVGARPCSRASRTSSFAAAPGVSARSGAATTRPAQWCGSTTRLALVLPDTELAEIPGQAGDAHVSDAAVIGEKIAEFAL
jgi:hypothetical protein